MSKAPDPNDIAETFLKCVVFIGVILWSLLALDAGMSGDVREWIACLAHVGELLCIYGLYRSLIWRLERWRDRKIAEIEARRPTP